MPDGFSARVGPGSGAVCGSSRAQPARVEKAAARDRGRGPGALPVVPVFPGAMAEHAGLVPLTQLSRSPHPVVSLRSPTTLCRKAPCTTVAAKGNTVVQAGFLHNGDSTRPTG